jgi:hypothetical protein
VYLAQTDAAKARMLACPNADGLDMPYFVAVRADLLAEADPVRAAANREAIAGFVAKALGAWGSAANKPADATKRLVKTYAEDGIKVTEAEDIDGQRTAFQVLRAAPHRSPSCWMASSTSWSAREHSLRPRGRRVPI